MFNFEFFGNACKQNARVTSSAKNGPRFTSEGPVLRGNAIIRVVEPDVYAKRTVLIPADAPAVVTAAVAGNASPATMADRQGRKCELAHGLLPS